ncbi:unnamed protein product [Orchesella dallaii]|uniref:Ferric-chelate reductase 1 n=1 Tax=Orchesella dallaii TaxID=48710 RepID=A0ABP1RMF2_9HEXA
MNLCLLVVLASHIASSCGQTCGEADTALPPYPPLPPGTDFTQFTPMDWKRSNTIASMFHESGVTRHCYNWEPAPNDKCIQNLSCRSLVCLGHQSNEPKLDLVEITVEIYGYAEDEGWIAVAFSRNATTSPLADALQIECLRKKSEIILQAAYIDDKGEKRYMPSSKTDIFMKQIDFIADSGLLLKNHLYCKVYLKQSIEVDIPGKSPYTFDFKREKYYAIPAVGSEFIESDSGYFPTDPCSRPAPKSSALPVLLFKSLEPSMLNRWHLAAHGWIMVFCFIFLFPCSLFPVRYLRLHLNMDNASWGIKQYKKTHILYALPTYPLMLLSWHFARAAHGRQPQFVPSGSSSFYHGTAGVACLQVFFIQGFLLLFSYGALLIESNKFYLFWHTLINYVTYLFVGTVFWSLRTTRYTGLPNAFQGWLNAFLIFQCLIHFIMTFYHWFIRLFNYKDDGYFMAAQTPSFTKALTQGTKEIQRQPHRRFQIFIWWVHNILCIVTAAILIYLIRADEGDGFPEHSRNLFPKLSWAGQIMWKWPYYWIYVE